MSYSKSKKNINKGLDKLLRKARGLSLVRRWNFHPTIKAESVIEHTGWVAFYSLLLTELENKMGERIISEGKVFRLAVLHDLEEAVSGDLPSLIKKAFRKSTDEIEDAAIEEILRDLPDWLRERWFLNWKEIRYPDKSIETKIVKAADLLSALFYALSEEQLGNRTFARIIKESVYVLRQLKLKSVDYVLKEVGETQGILPIKDLSHL